MLVQILFDECYKKIQKNIVSVQQKLTELFSTNPVGGKLVDTLRKEGMQGAFDLLKDYVVTNAAAFASAAVAASPAAGVLSAAFEMMQSAMAMFISLFDDAVLYMLKKSAKKALEHLERKSILLDKAEKEFIICYNILVALSAGDPIYEAYLDRLRRAIIELDLAEKDWTLVRSYLKPENPTIPSKFLDDVHIRAQNHVYTARQLITPQTHPDYVSKTWSRGVAEKGASKFFDALSDENYLQAGIAVADPYMAATYSLVKESANPENNLGGARKATPRTVAKKGVNNIAFLARQIGAPAQDEQIANWGMLANQTKKVAESMSGYIETLTRVNLQLTLFAGGLAKLESELPKFLVKYTLKILDRLLVESKAIKEDMAINVNGDRDAIEKPYRPNYRPVVFVLSGLSYVWASRVELLWHESELIPYKSFKILNLKNEQKEVYNDTVRRLSGLDDIVTATTVLPAEDGKELIGALEAQVAAWILEANAALYTFSVKEETLEAGRGLVERFALTRARDAEIYQILDSFIKFQEGADEKMELYGKQLEETMKNAKADWMLGNWAGGDWENFFKMSPDNMSTVGAALAVFAAIQKCREGDENADDLDEVQEKLFGLSDLLHINLDLDLDFNIFKNIQDCIDLKGLARKFDLQKLICKLTEEFSDKKTPAGKAEKSTFDKIKEAFKVATDPGAGMASVLSGAENLSSSLAGGVTPKS